MLPRYETAREHYARSPENFAVQRHRADLALAPKLGPIHHLRTAPFEPPGSIEAVDLPFTRIGVRREGRSMGPLGFTIRPGNIVCWVTQ